MLIRFGDSPQLSQFGLLCNTGDAGLLSNISKAVKLGLPEVEYFKPVTQPAVVCGGGPSLAETLESIRELKENGARVFALNNAAKYLTEHGIRPDVQIVVDPREQNVAFLEKVWSDELLLASQCHPAMFERAKEIGYPVRIWHTGMKDIEKVVTTGKQCWIGGGITVGLAGLCLIYTLGHRVIHLFGYDSSHAEDRGHAYRQAIDCEMVDCAVDNRVFSSSIAMATQAIEFKGVSDMLLENGCELHVYGDGLLPTFWRVWQRDKTERAFTAVYDLGLSPASFDFNYFMREAEKHRKEKKFDHIDVVFQPGPMFGFRNENPLPPAEYSSEMLWRVCVGTARKHPSVRNIEVLKKRRPIQGYVFPEGYLEDSPKSCFKPEVLLEKTS